MKNFNEIWAIYKEAFPLDECRDLEKQKEILNNSLYKLNPIYDKNKLVGFIALWDIDSFIFIEHFAIKKEFRGKGYGKKIIKEVINNYNKDIILEVERPTTTNSKRRIEFYKRLGFCLNEYEYYQPAYNNDTKSIPLHIMSYNKKMTEVEFNKVKRELYTKVYGAEDILI